MSFHSSVRLIVSAAALAASAAAQAGTLNYFGSSDQFAIDSDTGATAVTAIKNSMPSTGASIGTFGHGREGFGAVTSLGTLYSGGAGQALYIGDSYAGTGNRNAFDHSIVKVTFGSAIVNGAGADIALMVASGLSASTDKGHYRETVAVGVDSSIAAGNYTNTLWYEAAVDYKNNSTGGNGYLTYTFDLSDMGVAEGASITELFISNFDVFSTVSNADGLSGWVDLAGAGGFRIEGGSTYSLGGPAAPAGANSYYVSTPAGTNSHFDTDPDLLYVGGLSSAAVPLPGSLALAGLALAGLAASSRRRR